MDLIFTPRRSLLRVAGLTLAAVGLAVAPPAAAQETAGPATAPRGPQRLVPEGAPTPEEPTAVVEPQLFSSIEAGFELKMPDGVRQPTDGPNTLAVVTEPQKQWRFEVQRMALASPSPLETRQLDEGGRQAGLLEVMTSETTRETGGQIIRSEVTPLGEGEAGIIVVHYETENGSRIKQIALIPVTDLLYHRLEMTSPAPADASAMAEDDNVKAAAAAFQEALNTFKRLDQGVIREDQEQRLFWTRYTLLPNLTRPLILGSLEPEQWWRIRRAGEDIGWAHIREQPADGIPNGRGNEGEVEPSLAKGVRIGIQTHLVTNEATIDRFTWNWAAFDRQEEKFLEETVLSRDGKIEKEGFVAGSMTARRVPHKVRKPRPTGVGFDESIEIVDERRLEVSFSVGKGDPEPPMVRDLPPWYLQQAMVHLLPRLAAPSGRRKYLIAMYDPTRTEIWQQYVDVEGPRNVRVFGSEELVMVVTTRMGYSGDPTTHYVTTEGYRWLGSINEATGVEIQPVDEKTIRGIWGADTVEEVEEQNEAEN